MINVIITGVTGQDGSHMCDYLLHHFSSLDKPYKIYGTVRRLSVKNHENILHLKNNPNFELIDMDLSDAHSIRDIIIDVNPDYFINFAAQSFVAGSWKYPVQTWNTDANAVMDILESLRRFAPNGRFYKAGSSEEFGDIIYSPQDELHPLKPQSPYGAAKCAARHLVRVYRESYGLFAIQGWLFNHEGSRRGIEFVTRKISNGIAKIKIAIENNKKIPILELGNLDAERDWSDAEDFMEGVWLMLNNTQPINYVLASGKMNSVRDFVCLCLDRANISYSITGAEEQEKILDAEGNVLVQVNPDFFRPAEVHELLGNPSLAESELGWVRKCDFKSLVYKMYDNDYSLLNK